MQWIAAVLVVVLLALSLLIGNIAGAKSEREEVAKECRTAGAFTVKRTGFTCEKLP